jgi:rhamnose transport system permease protein
MARELARRLRSWEGLLLVLLFVVLLYNITRVPNYLTVVNQINLFQLGIEKAIVILAMTFVIISGEIDLSVASMMGLAAAIAASLFESGVPMPLAILAALAVGAGFGLLNGFFVSVVGLSSLAVTLAGYVGFRGLARLLVQDRSVGGFPDWFTNLGQQGLVGPITLSILIFAALAIVGTIVLHFSGLGRLTYVVGNSAAVARFSGVPVARTKLVIFMMSGLVSALAGVLMAARLGAVRASTAEGFELDIITVVLLGGVSIFGGVGTMVGVLLSTYLVLNLRNGLVIAGVTGNTQTGIIGLLLILSVLLPNLVTRARERLRRQVDSGLRAPPDAVAAEPVRSQSAIG